MAYIQLEDLYGSIEMVAFPKLFAQYETLLQPGQVLLVQGRLDVQEEKEPKLLGERIEPVPSTPPVIPASEPTRSHKAGLYLRLSSNHDDLYDRVTAMLPQHSGVLPVYIRFTDSGKLVRAPQNYWVTPSQELILKLEQLLGADNVALLN